MSENSPSLLPLTRLPDISEIKLRRQALGLNQRKFAIQFKIGQSYLAKIERGVANPSYTLAKKIFTKLSELERRDAIRIKTARDIVSIGLESVSTRDKIQDAMTLMVRYDISQLPVIDDAKVKGSITDEKIIKLFKTTGSYDKVMSIRIKEVMEGKFPVVAPEADVDAIRRNLQKHAAVLVVLDSNVGLRNYGIITKHDILKTVLA